MRYIVPVMMMIAATELGCQSRKPRRSARHEPTKPAAAEPDARSLSELAPQDARPRPPEPTFPSEPSPPRPAATPELTYRVVKGDTYWSIAQRVYGDGKFWARIKQANPGVDMNSLKVGQVIKIPPK